MTAGLLRFEWRYHTRRLTFAASALCFAVLGFGLAATAFGPNDVRLNSPYSIAESLGVLSLTSVFVVTLFCAQAALRDLEHRMAEVVFATAVTKPRYLLGRFFGILLAATAAFAFAVPGLLAGAFAVAHDPARLGPFDPLPYLWSFGLFAVPNLLLVAALLFAVAVWSRSTLATYVAGVAIYMLYFVAALFSDSPLMASSSPQTAQGMAIAALLDPFGLSAFFEQTHHWTVAERDLRGIAASGHLLANRVLWIGVALSVLGLVYRHFAFRLPEDGRARAAESGAIERAAPPLADRRYRSVAVDSRRGAAWRALVSASRVELRHSLRSWPFLALLVGWVGVVAIELLQTFRRAEFGSALVPNTGLILGELHAPLGLFGLITLIYFSAELVWRERAAGMAEVVDATPVGNAVLLASKIVALASLVVVLTLTATGVALGIQLASGVGELTPHLYASLLLFDGLPLLLVAVLAVLVQTVMPNRYVGMLVTLVAVVVWHQGGLGGPEHPLLRFAAHPEVPYSDLAGFGPETLSFGWFMAYWSAFTGLLAIFAGGMWRRGVESSWRHRLAALRRRAAGNSRGVASVLVLLCGVAWLGLGGAVYYQTNRLNTYRTDAELRAWRADYERTYRRLERLAQPTPAAVDVHVDLYPSLRRYRVRGTYRLVNRSPAPIPSLWVVVRRDLSRVALRLAGAPPSSRDARFGTYRFTLDPPLAPGAGTTLAFDVEVARRGATAGDADQGIVRNGSFLLSTFSLPTLGYRRSYEIRDPDERRREGLAASSRPATFEGAEAAGMSNDAEARVAFDATLSTEGDQTALAPGARIATWEREGRRFYRYRAERPIRPFFAFVSARYAVARARHGGVDVEVYYHPGHRRNVPRILAAAGSALDYCSSQFGPYPHHTLRVVELPSSWRRFSGFAMPGIIYVLENRGFLTDLTEPGRVDVLTKRVAHEVAHQWWGHQLVPAELPGASALVESLARYTEMRVLAMTYGEAAVPQVLSYELDRYLEGRTGGDEVPLADVTDQAYIYYAKGSLVMAAVRDLLGEEATHRALRELLAADTASPPTARDLVDHLTRLAPARDRALVEQWWRRIVLYDLRATDAQATPLGDGRYRLAVRVTASKVEVALDGRAQPPVAVDEALDVAAYAEYPDLAGRRVRPLGIVRQRIRGTAEVSLVVRGLPRYVVVDPGLLRIERDRQDNLHTVRVGK